jgi:signal transduction histidine kinase
MMLGRGSDVAVTMDEMLGEEWRQRELARLHLIQLQVDDAVALEPALTRAATISGDALHVGRVGIWTLDPAASELRCDVLVDRDDPRLRGEHPALRIADLGTYERALETRRAIAAADVKDEPLTRDIVSTYFAPRDIQATLDVPIYVDGRVVGVVCHEHRGTTRVWTQPEADFAISVADVVGLLLASARLKSAEQKLREREVALREALQHDAIARVAGSVGHDLASLLAVVTMNVELIDKRGDDAALRTTALATISDATASALRLARQLSSVGARRRAGRAALIDGVIQRYVPTLRSVLGGKRTLEVSLGTLGRAVRLDRSQIEQLLLNLVGNAREATRENGHVSIRTREEPSRVILSVQDDGAGMTDEVKARAKEPFFSTKDPRVHGGLGLATVHGLVVAAGGTLQIASSPGEGATFEISLPIAPRATDSEL